MTASTRWRAWLVAVAIAAALLGAALLARMSPALSLALTLALPGAESWLAPLHAEVVVEEMSIEAGGRRLDGHFLDDEDRKSTRLNSSHLVISYAVFCLKKKD